MNKTHTLLVLVIFFSSNTLALAPSSQENSIHLNMCAQLFYHSNHQRVLKEMPQTYTEFNQKQHVEKARSRAFFKMGTTQTNACYPQNVSLMPENVQNLQSIQSQLKSITSHKLWLPDPSSYHISIHTLYFSTQQREASNIFLNYPQLTEKYRKSIHKHFSEKQNLCFDQLILTKDGSLILCGTFKNATGNLSMQNLRKELLNIQKNIIKDDLDKIPGSSTAQLSKPIDIIHLSLGRLLPNWDTQRPSFLLTKEQFRQLKHFIDAYNTQSLEQKLAVDFDRISLMCSKSPVHENPIWQEHLFLEHSA